METKIITVFLFESAITLSFMILIYSIISIAIEIKNPGSANVKSTKIVILVFSTIIGVLFNKIYF